MRRSMSRAELGGKPLRPSPEPAWKAAVAGQGLRLEAFTWLFAGVPAQVLEMLDEALSAPGAGERPEA